MSSDPNRKTARNFQCRDVLWETFEQMARELECSIDYLINEAMKQYARQRSYSPGATTTSGQSRAAMEASVPKPAAVEQPQQQPTNPAPPGYPSMPAVPSPAPSPMGQSAYGGFGAPPPPPPSAQTFRAQPPPPAAMPSPARFQTAPAMPTRSAPPPPAVAAPGVVRHAPSAPQPPPMVPMATLQPRPPTLPAGSMVQPPPLAPAIPQARSAPPPPMPYAPPVAAPPAHPQQHPGFAPPPLQGMPQMGGPGPIPPPMPVPQQYAPPPPMPQQQVGPGGMPLLSAYYDGQRHVVNKERFIIGRGKQTSDLTIKDPNVSRQHAMIEYLNGQFYMVDMGSTNGVEYNGQRIARRPIAEGDSYRICDHELRFSYR